MADEGRSSKGGCAGEERTPLEALLRSFAGAIVAISHDRYSLDRISVMTVEIRAGKYVATRVATTTGETLRVNTPASWR